MSTVSETDPRGTIDARPQPKTPRRGWWRTAGWIVAALVSAFALIQLVPYGRDHTNPPVTAEPAWDSPQTRALVAAACFDCHSNQTNWYWYTNIAPVSWLTQHDVDEGRATLNFSEWDRPQEADPNDIAELVHSGEMPPWYYRLAHSASRLTDAQKQQLIDGLRRTFQASPPIPGG